MNNKNHSSDSEWKKYKWGDLATLEYGKSLGNYLREDGKYPVYGTNGRIGTTDNLLCPFPSIIVGRKGAYRGIHYSKTPFYVIDTAFYLNPKIPDFDITFAYYQLLTVDINYMDSGSAIPSTSREDFYDIDIFLPPINEQRAIASILSSLDDKIDLLHRQNKTLEQLAETLFRQWFVEEENKDWEEKSLDQIADYLNGLACQKYPPLDKINKLPVIKIKDIKNGFSDNSDWVTSEVPQKYIMECGDILFSWSGSLEVMIWAHGQGVLNQHLFKVSSTEYPKWLFYFATKLHLADFRVIAESKSTTMGHIQREHLSAAKIKIPNEENILKEMDNTLSPLINKIIINFGQIESLKKMRDTLLPKLMSGEIRLNCDSYD